MKTISLTTTKEFKVPETPRECEGTSCVECAYYDTQGSGCKHNLVLEALE